jgi:hypothetical protein
MGSSTEAFAQTGAAISTSTKSGYKKSNQSKVFYHDSQWWALAFYEPDGRWYIWRWQGTTWVRTRAVRLAVPNHWDAVLDSDTGKLYLFASRNSAPEFRRCSYAAGTWNLDNGYPVIVSGFTNQDLGNSVSLVRAKNGDFWLFRIVSNNLQARRSTDEGLTWSANITVKTGLTTANGTTDAVAFSFSSDDYVGVAYGEANAPGNHYGFLRHRDGDPTTSWTDESASLAFFGNERAYNSPCMTTDANNNVYLFTRNVNVSGSDPRNTLYKRTSAGIWEKYKVNSIPSLNWKTPAIAIDGSNNTIYVMGVNTSTQQAEYKTCLIGQEANLEGATPVALLAGVGASFDDLSVPAANVDGIMGLMVCGDNTTASDIWYRHLTIGTTDPITIGTVTVNSNQVNANATYTIPLTLSNAGALNAGTGTLHFRFPGTTFVPDVINASAVLVDGTPATSVISNSSTRQVTVTTPVNLPNNDAFSVVFNPGAGLLNPITTGGYKVTVWTSAQPTQVISTNYNIIPTTTSVTAATVLPAQTTPSTCTSYTISFNLGPQGRLISGTSTFTVTFGATTTVANGALAGATVNGVAATATGNSIAKTVTITLPATVNLTNNDTVMLFLPSPAICNPSSFGSYTLTVATSVETTPATSNPYYMIAPVTIDTVMVAPAQVGAPANYNISLELADTGALTAGVDQVSFRFPAGTVVPNSMAAGQITVDGTPATLVVSDSATREVHITTPVSLPNSDNFPVIFNTGAGLYNPGNPGNYSLEAWTSVQTMAATSPLYALEADTGSAIATTTQSGYKKSNQNKVFYHDGLWWALAFYSPDDRWYIWRYNGTFWVRTRDLRKNISYRWDAVLDSDTGKLYLFGSNKVDPEFRRYSYAGGTWNKDAEFPITHADFTNAEQGNPVSLVQAQNGDLWIFRVSNDSLQAKRSADGGVTWSSIIPIKTGLNTPTATTDAVSFSSGGNDYTGVAYGEHDSPASRYGFLLHRDGDPDGTWTDESSSLTFFGSERAHNNISMIVDADNNVYLFTRNVNVTGNHPRNTLYKRSNTGVWQKFKVNATSALNWRAPVAAIDAGNNVLYLMGVNTNTLKGEYKICALGQEAALENAAVTTLFSGGEFDDLNLPAANVDAVSGIMVCVDNLTADDIWYRHLAISGTVPILLDTVTVVSNEINANATYTVSIRLSNSGALAAGSGVINLRFPNNTFVPNNMPASAVKVDGTPATSIIANNSTRLVSITTPVNLPKNYSFKVVFDSTAGAGILNPTWVDTGYTLTGWTSAQPLQTTSRRYSLVQTTTTVTPATVAPFPTDPDSMANYTISFNLGAHGRLLADSSTITVKFGSATKVANGNISGAKLNNTTATASGDSGLRKVNFTVPSSETLSNNAVVTLFLPTSAMRNPAITGSYTLMVATSVETTYVASNPYMIEPNNSIGAPIANTTKYFDRNNQSKMFYHDGNWWLTAQSKIDQDWYLWKFDGIFWTQHILIHDATKSRPDCILDAANNKAYILLPGSSTTYITRLSYSGGSWSVDSGYPYVISNFVQGGDRGINLVRASNGHLWVFMVSDSTLLAKRSTNNGQTWSATITVKDSLNNNDALTDAVAFAASGNNYIGVGYAENSATGSVYAFLRHRNSDPDTVWTDETTAIPQFSGTTSDDHLSMAVSNNEVFMVIKTNGGGPATTNIGLLHRKTNGDWSQYPIFLSTGWTRPTLIVDETHNRLYVIGTREGPVKVGEMKNVAIGDYSSLESAPIDTIFMNEVDEFFDVSVAAHTVNGTMNLLVCNGNETRNELWYNLITLGGAPKLKSEETITVEEENFEGVQVFPNPFNPSTSFRFRVRENTAVKLQIFNLNGQLVRTLVDGNLAPKVYKERWNGRNEKGHPVASGIYFYRLQIGRQIWNGKIQMIK